MYRDHGIIAKKNSRGSGGWIYILPSFSSMAVCEMVENHHFVSDPVLIYDNIPLEEILTIKPVATFVPSLGRRKRKEKTTNVEVTIPKIKIKKTKIIKKMTLKKRKKKEEVDQCSNEDVMRDILKNQEKMMHKQNTMFECFGKAIVQNQQGILKMNNEMGIATSLVPSGDYWFELKELYMRIIKLSVYGILQNTFATIKKCSIVHGLSFETFQKIIIVNQLICADCSKSKERITPCLQCEVIQPRPLVSKNSIVKIFAVKTWSRALIIFGDDILFRCYNANEERVSTVSVIAPWCEFNGRRGIVMFMEEDGKMKIFIPRARVEAITLENNNCVRLESIDRELYGSLEYKTPESIKMIPITIAYRGNSHLVIEGQVSVFDENGTMSSGKNYVS